MIELGGTAATWINVGVGVGLEEIVADADNFFASAALGGWVKSGGTAALNSVIGSSGNDLSVQVIGIWTAEILGWVEQVSATALLVIWVVDDSVETAKRSGRVICNTITAITVSNVANAKGSLWFVDVDGTTIIILSILYVVVLINKAASLGGWVEGPGITAALEVSVGVGENAGFTRKFVFTADLGGRVESSVSAAGQASSGGSFASTASLGGRVEGSSSAALVSVGGALNSTITAALGGGVEGS